MNESKYITAENSEFKPTGGGFVSLTFEGEFHERVEAYRCFPFSDPDVFISIREYDEKAREIGMIRDLNDMGEAAELLRGQMGVRYFTPEITRIKNIRDEYGYGYFDVSTDRGDIQFIIRMNGNAIARLSDTRLLISDIDGNRFEIRDTGKLTASEQKKLELYY